MNKTFIKFSSSIICLLSSFLYSTQNEVDYYKEGIDISYNQIINVLIEEIVYSYEIVEKFNDPSKGIEANKINSHIEYWIAKMDFYRDCKKIIEEKYPVQMKEREKSLKFIETTRNF